MKNFKWTLILGLMTFLGQQSVAQISVSPQLGFHQFLGGSSVNALAFGARIDYTKEEKLLIGGFVNFHTKYTDSYEISALSNSDDPDLPTTTEVEVGYEVSVMHIGLGIKKYFVNGSTWDAGVYYIVEAGLITAKVTEELGTVPEGYSKPAIAPEETLANLTVQGGIGGEVDMEFGHLYGELRLNLPANKSGNTDIEVQLPASMTFFLGLRIPFN